MYLCTVSTPGTYAIHTLGCKLNYAESSTLGRQLDAAGWQPSGADLPASLYILNTCSVTEFADKKCRQAVRRLRRQAPESKIIVTGCYAQLKPEEIANIEGVDLVLGAAEKFQLLDYVERLQYGTAMPDVVCSEIARHNTFTASYSYRSRTRTFLKVQDGCDYKCSFCTIPLARGGSRSATLMNVYEQAQTLAEEGVQEIVLTGVNTGDFGLNEEGHRVSSFIELLRSLDQVDIPRIRISSIEPNLCHDELIHYVAESNRIMPHFHMPLQSGSDRMLKLMRRRYKTQLYADRVGLIKKLMPHACIGVDVIVGFHGEDEDGFQQTRTFVEGLDVSYLHVFTYSERADTHALSMDGRVPMEVRRQRNETLRSLSSKKKHYFYYNHLGETRDVLFESQDDEGRWQGYTDNYIYVCVLEDQVSSGDVKSVVLDEILDANRVLGNLISKSNC